MFKNIKTFIEGILDKELLSIGKIHFKIEHIFIILLVFFVTRILLKFIRKAFSIAARKKNMPRTEWFTYYTIVKYFIWLISITIMLNFLGVDVTVLVAGSSALLVGFGLGIQRTFLDFFSGLLLLYEKKIKLGDIIEMSDGKVVKITEIGMRFSQGIDRADINILIPNSFLTNNEVNYWSADQKASRFTIHVGIAYHEDIKLVNKLLEESLLEHNLINTHPKPIIRLASFGESSLNFELLFWSQEKFRILQVVSDINNIIIHKLAKNNIRIPFPQRDIHIIPSKEPFVNNNIIIENDETNP